MELNVLVDFLSDNELFIPIKKAEIEALLYKSMYSLKTYSKSDVFALAGDRVNHLMIVIKGALNARMVSESGKYIQIDKIDEGRIVAPAMLFASENVFPVNVIPDEDTLVLFIHREEFLKMMHRNEYLLHNFIRIVSDINRFLSTKIHSLSLKTIRGKLAEYLLHESEKAGGSQVITLTLSKQNLADKFAIARQALSRSLSELEEDGLILLQGKKITLLDKKGLSEID